jgi:hypothetical protein
MDQNLLRRLLAQGESSHLDYKSEQYRFSQGSLEDKAELLKDVLAMVNAWRDTDAYILIGVKEVPGHKAEIVGITQHLNDADLQEFVNQKTNRPIHFAYVPVEVDGTSVAVLHIPLQQRPFFLRKRFGALDPDKVYLRRGSSTDIADADEVFTMGASLALPSRPSLRVEFADLKKREALGQTLALKRKVLRPLRNEDLPPDPNEGGGVGPYGIRLPRFGPDVINANYWRELRDYLCARSTVGSVGFAVTNTSSVVATGVRAKLTVPHSDQVLFVEEPERPDFLLNPAIANLSSVAFTNRTNDLSVEYRRHGDTWHIEIRFGKVQPKDTAWTDDELIVGNRGQTRSRSDGTHLR